MVPLSFPCCAWGLGGEFDVTSLLSFSLCHEDQSELHPSPENSKNSVSILTGVKLREIAVLITGQCQLSLFRQGELVQGVPARIVRRLVCKECRKQIQKKSRDEILHHPRRQSIPPKGSLKVNGTGFVYTEGKFAGKSKNKSQPY